MTQKENKTRNTNLLKELSKKSHPDTQNLRESREDRIQK